MTTGATCPSILLAYLHLRPGVPQETRELLKDYIANFAEREGFVLERIFVGIENRSERNAVRRLVAHVRASGTCTVLIAGPAEKALTAMRELPEIEVLTLADVSRTASGDRNPRLHP